MDVAKTKRSFVESSAWREAAKGANDACRAAAAHRFTEHGSDAHRVRRIDLTTGIVTTVAGKLSDGGLTSPCSSGPCGDGGAALAAGMFNPSAVQVAADGTLYIADRGNRIRAVGTDGIIRTVATGFFNPQLDLALAEDGTLYIAGGLSKVRRRTSDGRLTDFAGSGTGGDSGDGGLATTAQVFNVTGLALGADGGLFLTDYAYHRVRRVGPEGIITALAGRPEALNVVVPYNPADENGPALAAAFANPVRVATAPDGSLYMVDQGQKRVRRVRSPLPGFAALGDLVIASRDGSELYVFDSRGRHLRTVDALTTAVRYQFSYDAEGRIAAVTDVDGRQLAITRPSASTVVLTGPDGQATTLTLDANGYVQAIATAAGTTTVGTSAEGLIGSVTDPNAQTRTFTYGTGGRLNVAQDPAAAGGSDTLSRTSLAVPNGTGYQVMHTTADGVQTAYKVEFLPTGAERRTTVNPDGTQAVTVIAPDGSRTITRADGTVQTSAIGPDPRFGLQAPVPASTTVTTPQGHVATITASSDAEPDGAGPLDFDTLTDTASINGRTVTREYDAATRTYTDTTPAGRITTTVLDPKGRVAKTQIAGLHPTRQGYDLEGRVTAIKQGPDPDTAETRTTQLSYVDAFAIELEGYPQEAKGQIKTVEDALNREVRFEYDSHGRVSVQILPDGREIGFQYDAAGNVTAIIPPGRPAHSFTYNSVNLEEVYTPPQAIPPLVDPTTTIAYTADREIDYLTRPDGGVIDFDYDAAGRLDLQTLPDPSLPGGSAYRDYVYDPTTGNLAQILAPDATLEMSYDGALPTGEAWSGPGIAAATFTRTYDDSLRVQTQQVSSETPIAFIYDDDDLLVQAGALTLTRDPQNGLLTDTSLTEGAGTITDHYDYDLFGQVSHYEAKYNGSPIFAQTYTRDDLGRITSIVESKTIAPDPPQTSEKHYAYDPAGRLFRVCPDAACSTITSEYHYDANGNRIAPSFNQQGAVTSAVYDDQDRLLSMTVGPTTTDYTYTDNGELLTKTDPSGTTTYAYDAVGNLREVALPDGTVIDYLVDGRNRRIGKIVDGVLEKQWLYQDQLEPVAELDGGGNLIAEFVYSSRAHVPDQILRNGETYRVISDHLGSPRLLIDAVEGALAQHLNYDECGLVLEDTNAGWQPFGFVGGIYDVSTNLVRFGARDHDGVLGRWTTKDPIGFAGGDPNVYTYALQDPINRIDPDGRDSTLGGALGGIALAGVVADIALNIRILKGLGGKAVVQIPPPSAFDRGLPLPFFFGAGFVVREVRLPVLGIIGVPESFYITADPILRLWLSQGGEL